MSELSISNFVKVSSDVTIEELAEFSIGSVAIFTEEAPSVVFENGYSAYRNISNIEKHFGISSKTYKIASKIFSQGENGIDNVAKSRLIVIPMSATTGSRAKTTTIDLTTNKEAIRLISNGDLKITIDGVANNLTGLNFTKTRESDSYFIDDVIKVLKNKKLNCDIVKNATNNNKIDFITKNVGADSTITIGQYAGSGSDLSISTLFDTENSVAVAGTDTSGTETIQTAMNRMIGSGVQYVGFTTTLLLDVDQIISLYEYMVANESLKSKVFVYNISNSSDCGIIKTSIFDTVSGGGNSVLQIKLIQGLLDQENSLYLRGAVLSQGFGNDVFTELRRSLHGKTLNGVNTLSSRQVMTQDIFDNAIDKGIDTYGYFEKGFGNAVYESSNSMGLTNIVLVRNIENVLQTNIVNKFRLLKSIDKNDDDLSCIKSEIENILEVFRKNKAFGLGDGINDASSYDILNSKLELAEKGYHVYIPLVSEIEGQEVPVYITYKIAKSVLKFDFKISIK